MPKQSLHQQLSSFSYKEKNVAEEIDDFFSDIPEIPSAPGKLKVVSLPIEKLVEYKDENFEKITGRPQPFRAYSEDDLKTLASSIAEHGIIDPITVRPLADGTYQIIAGRNRKRASAICGMTEIPGIVRRDIDDMQAAMIMLDTNLEQRHNLSYSEKAYAYKMRIDLQNRQGKRTDLDTEAEKIDTLSEAGKKNKDKRRTVAYLIRLTYLLPDLIQMVDNGIIGFKVGVSISYLSHETQKYLLKTIIPSGKKIKQSQIETLRRLEEMSTLNSKTILSVFESSEKPIPQTVKISGKKLVDYADILKSTEDVERLFLEFLESYKKQVSV